MMTQPPVPPRSSPSLLLVVIAILTVVFGVPAILFGGLGVIFALASFSTDPGGALTTIIVLLGIILVPLTAGGWLVLVALRALRRPAQPQPDRPAGG